MNQPPNTTEEKSKCKKCIRDWNPDYCDCECHIPTPSVCEVAKEEKWQCIDCYTIFTGIGDLHCPECDGSMHEIGCSSPIELEDKVLAIDLKLTSSSPVYIRTEPKKTVEKQLVNHPNGKCKPEDECPYCNTDLPLVEPVGHPVFNWHLNGHDTSIQTGNDGSWKDEYLRTTKRAILKVGENSPASQYLVNVVEEQIDKFIQKAVLQERERIQIMMEKLKMKHEEGEDATDYIKVSSYNSAINYCLGLLDNKQ